MIMQTRIQMPTREEIAQAIYDSQEGFIGPIEDCRIAADAVMALYSNKD